MEREGSGKLGTRNSKPELLRAPAVFRSFPQFSIFLAACRRAESNWIKANQSRSRPIKVKRGRSIAKLLQGVSREEPDPWALALFRAVLRVSIRGPTQRVLYLRIQLSFSKAGRICSP